MTSRNLERRVTTLEARVPPQSEPIVIFLEPAGQEPGSAAICDEIEFTRTASEDADSFQDRIESELLALWPDRRCHLVGLLPSSEVPRAFA